MVVGLVAYKILAEIVDKPIRTVIDGHTSKGHIIGVEHAVAEAYCLPLCDELGGVSDKSFVEGFVGVLVFRTDVGEVLGDGVVCKGSEGATVLEGIWLVHLGVFEADLETAEAEEGLTGAQDYRSVLESYVAVVEWVALDRLVSNH